MKLKAQKRETLGSSSAKQARQENLVTAVIYEAGKESTPILVDRKEFDDLLRKLGRNAVFNIDMDGKDTQVIIKNIDHSALKPVIYNLELQALQEGQTVTVEVTVDLVGVEKIVDGVLAQVLNTVEVETLPASIPNMISHQVGDLAIGDTVTVGELVVPEGVTILTDAEETVATVSAPSVEEETDPDAEAAEPEVIGEADSE